jgi:hypothetical protein
MDATSAPVTIAADPQAVSAEVTLRLAAVWSSAEHAAAAPGRWAWNVLLRPGILVMFGPSHRLRPRAASLRPAAGQRRAMLWFRTGSKLGVPSAIKVLDVQTTG